MSRMSVSKEFTFDAAHSLPEYNGPCQRLHGHCWKLVVEVSGEVSKNSGMLLDFSKLKRLVNALIIDKVDHTHLNDLFPMPTAELLVKNFVDTLEGPLLAVGATLESVQLFETSDNCAKWSRE